MKKQQQQTFTYFGFRRMTESYDVTKFVCVFRPEYEIVAQTRKEYTFFGHEKKISNNLNKQSKNFSRTNQAQQQRLFFPIFNDDKYVIIRFVVDYSLFPQKIKHTHSANRQKKKIRFFTFLSLFLSVFD